MSFSKCTIQKLVDHVIYNEGGRRNDYSWLDKPVEHYAHECESMLGWQDLVIDFNGVRSPGDGFGAIDYCGLDKAAINGVYDVFETLDEIHPTKAGDLVASTHYAGSYHLKHVLERIRRKRGDTAVEDVHSFRKDGYVSNGEFIIGYLLFLSGHCGLDRRLLDGVFMRRVSPNIVCRLPATFAAMVRYLDERNAI